MVTASDRAGALVTGLLVLLIAVEGAFGAHSYDLVLAAAVLLIGLPAAVTMWRGNAFEARLVAFVLAGLALPGQVLLALVGVPGGSGGRWDLTAALVVLAAATTLVLLAVDAYYWGIAGRSRRDRVQHPYAL